MNTLEVAKDMNIDPAYAEKYLLECEDVVESAMYVATLKENTVHIAARVPGLGGRLLLKQCRATLAEWFSCHAVLYAPVKFGNNRAMRLAAVLGFTQYATDATYVWFKQTKEHFNVS